MSRRINTILEDRYDFHPKHTQRLSDLIYKAAENHSKLLPIRIDCHLNSQTHRNMTPIERDHFVRYFQIMQNKMRRNTTFKHFITHVAKIEYGHNRGWHMHLLMLFDGQYLKNDYHLSYQIGEYWIQTVRDHATDKHITASYYACNMDKERYNHCVLNTINSTESLNQSRLTGSSELEIFIDAMAYLTKIHQDTKDYFNEHQLDPHPRTIFFGQVKPKSNRGRSRNPATSSILDSLSDSLISDLMDTPSRRTTRQIKEKAH